MRELFVPCLGLGDGTEDAVDGERECLLTVCARSFDDGNLAKVLTGRCNGDHVHGRERVVGRSDLARFENGARHC